MKESDQPPRWLACFTKRALLPHSRDPGRGRDATYRPATRHCGVSVGMLSQPREQQERQSRTRTACAGRTAFDDGRSQGDMHLGSNRQRRMRPRSVRMLPVNSMLCWEGRDVAGWASLSDAALDRRKRHSLGLADATLALLRVQLGGDVFDRFDLACDALLACSSAHRGGTPSDCALSSTGPCHIPEGQNLCRTPAITPRRVALP